MNVQHTHDRHPEPFDVVIMIEYRGGGIDTITLTDPIAYEQQHLLARPRRLMGYALKLIWWRLRGRTVDKWSRLSDVFEDRS